MSVSAQIRIRRDTAANFTSANPTLALGEIAYETDTFRFKVGTGSTAWTALGYAAQNPTSLTVTDSTASTSTTTGALVVTGGVGIQGAVNIGGGATVRPNASAPTSSVVLGSNAGAAMQSGATNNTLVGQGAGDVITSSTNNTALGSNALGAMVSLSPQSTAIGHNALAAFIGTASQVGNTAIGASALQQVTTATGNTAVGTECLLVVTGGGNTAIGTQCGKAWTTATDTVLVGRRAGGVTNVGTGTSNVLIGSDVATAITSGSWNIMIGSGQAGVAFGIGRTLTTGTANILIGRCDVPAASTSNSIVIANQNGGSEIVGDGSDTTVIGNTSTTSTRIPAGNLTLSNGNLVLGTAGNGISFAATTDPTIAAVAAAGAIRGTATNVADNDTVTIDTTVYTFKTTLTPADYEVLIGADASASLTNLRHAILGTGGTPGTDYQVPAAHPTVTAGAIAGSTLPLTAITAGTAGNSIALAETSAELSVSAATLQGGAAAAGMSGELLNDYETGTWSPRLESTGGTLVGVNIVSNANYTKIGQLVTVQAYVQFNYADTSLASGQLRIAGLPYSVSGHAAAGLYSGQWTVSPAYVSANSGTTLGLFKRGSTSAQSGVAPSVPADLDTSTTASRNQMIVTLTYRTA